MKIMHTSDWHLGMMQRTHSFEADQRAFIDEMAAIIREENVEAILLAGDVFDRANAGRETVKFYDEVVTRICAEMGVKLLIVAGNHDNSARLATYNELVRAAGLFVVGELSADLTPVELGSADVYMLPWITTDRVRATFPEEAEDVKSMEDAYRVVLDHIRASFRPNRKHVIMAHAFIINAETSVSDRAAEVGHASAVSREVFDGFDYVALGHIHGPQDFEQVHYCGTPMAYSFGREETHKKRVIILDTETMEWKNRELHPLHARTTIKGTFEDVLAAKGISEDVRNGYVRVETPDMHLGLEAASRLREVYPNLLEFVGRRDESDDATITLTIEDLDRLSNDPEEIFHQFCKDTKAYEPDEHTLELFRQAVAMYEKGEMA
ncbi:MAG: exonuclease SbcCD subunit D [Lachnospiraceae bacterium]|nr:exonuclease SbcCD subunit D [Lachnospiraceae bacterium]